MNLCLDTLEGSLQVVGADCLLLKHFSRGGPWIVFFTMLMQKWKVYMCEYMFGQTLLLPFYTFWTARVILTKPPAGEQNTAARVLTTTRTEDHVSPNIALLAGIYRMRFKIRTLSEHEPKY
ncbi:hypothetical protein AMECASPLE_035185 [Ameca splendens]|uniref:Uncharacterized protein n=1 Tax=Ameca splendens TaxID=208324 RepID=A0ABV0Y7J7_9TELE